jgi:hypothetical protein
MFGCAAWIWHGSCPRKDLGMATKLHLATFLEEIRCFPAVADRQPKRATLSGSIFPELAWPQNLPVGIQRVRLEVVMNPGTDGQVGWEVPITYVEARSQSRRICRSSPRPLHLASE